MNRFTSAEIPGWRFVLWGIVAALAVCGLGLYFSEPALFIAAGIVGCIMAGIGFFLRWSQRTGWAGRHLRTLFLISFVGQAILIIWKILEYRK